MGPAHLHYVAHYLFLYKYESLYTWSRFFNHNQTTIHVLGNLTFLSRSTINFIVEMQTVVWPFFSIDAFAF